MKLCYALTLLVLLTSIFAPSGFTEDAPQLKPLELTADSSLVFADEKAAREILNADDDFARRLSRFDLQSRLQTEKEVTREDWRKLVAEQITAWPAEEYEKIKLVIASLKPKLAELRLPLPKQILLIRTTGKEEADAAYTRANAIILPAAKLRHALPQLESLLTHELFHVLSRHDATTRAALYKIVGFTLGEELKIPQALEDRRITNPDAPRLDCFIKLTSDGQQVIAVPILYATPKQYDAQKRGKFFDYLTFRLLVVDQVAGKWQTRMKDEQPVVLDPKKVDSYYEQIGRNTSYVWHPDEILADNFVHLVNRRQNLATPRVTEGMAEVLKR